VSIDLVLSSGFLAFAAQAGVLRAVEDLDVEISGLCGTSSGALAGALWLGGMPADDILVRLTEVAPLWRVWPSTRPWRGALSMGPVIEQLRKDLPEGIGDLRLPFAAGVVGPGREPRLLTEGPLAESVAASCAIPGLFEPVQIGGVEYSDGGVRDRTGLGEWRRSRPDAQIVLHLVETTSGTPTSDDLSAIQVIYNPRSGARLWSLGDVQHRYQRARRNARKVLEAL